MLARIEVKSHGMSFVVQVPNQAEQLRWQTVALEDKRVVVLWSMSRSLPKPSRPSTVVGGHVDRGPRQGTCQEPVAPCFVLGEGRLDPDRYGTEGRVDADK